MSIVGKRVKHQKFGDGAVVGQISGSFMLLVKFDSGITFYVRRDETKEIETTTENPSPKLDKGITAVKDLPTPNVRDAAFIENLRLGISPRNVSSFTFGRDLELGTIQKWINEEHSPPIIIAGDYGSGKSHLLECIRQKYLIEGFAVSTLQLDPNECPLHKPKRVYSRIIKMLSAQKNGKAVDFREIIRDYAARRLPPLQNDYLDFVIEVCHEQEGSPNLIERTLDWIAGEGSNSLGNLPLYDDSPSANIYCYILGGISKLARNLGLKGFVVMLDEAEQLNGSSYAKYQFLKGLTFFSGLSLSTSASKLLDERPHMNPCPPPTIVGPRSGLPYSARKTIRYYEPLSSSFKLIFAFTDLDFLDGAMLERLANPEIIHLTPLDMGAKRDLLDYLYKIYKNAYPEFAYEYVDTLVEDLITSNQYSENTRILNKAFIEALDIVRYYSLRSHRGFLS